MLLCNEAGTWLHIKEHSTFLCQAVRTTVLSSLASEMCGQMNPHVTLCASVYNLLVPKLLPHEAVLTMHLLYKLLLARCASNSSSLSVIPVQGRAHNRKLMNICWHVKHFYIWKYFFEKIENHQIHHFPPFRIAMENWMLARAKDGSNQWRLHSWVVTEQVPELLLSKGNRISGSMLRLPGFKYWLS